MENINNSLTAVAAQEGPIVSVVGDTYRIVIGSEQTKGAYALIEMLIPPRGAAFFDSKATGKLAFLGNSVAIYKDITYNNGTDKVIGWEWK